MSDLSVYALMPIGAVPLHGLAPVGKVAFSTVYGAEGGCGLDSLTASMALRPGFSSPALTQGALLELRMGPTPLGRATLTTLDPESGAITAAGLAKRGGDFIAFADLTTHAGTLNLKTGIQNALTLGLEWKVDATTLDLLNVGVATTGAWALSNTTWYSISDLLDAYCSQQGVGTYWGIDAGGFLRIYQGPAAASYMLSPSVPAMDSTSTDYVTDLVCKYLDITKPVGDGSTFYASALVASVPVRAGSAKKFGDADLTSHGPLTAAQAKSIADQTLAQKSPTLSYSGGVNLTLGDARTLVGNIPIPLWRLVAEAGSGRMVRHHGWRNMQGALLPGFAQEWVIGKATYSDSGAVSLSPTTDAAKTLGQTLNDLGAGVLAAQSAAKTALAVGTPDYLQSLITEDSDTTSSSTMPTSAQMGDLWLNNPDAYICTTAYASGGAIANWTKVTDPRTLALMRTHAIAFLAADSAASDATTALAAANGKNKITGSTRTPTSADPGVDGDTWEYYVGGKISARYTYASGAWVSHVLRDEMIDTLTVGKVVGLDATFLDAHIDFLTSVTITSGKLYSSTGTMTVDLDNGKLLFYYGGSLAAQAAGGSSGFTVLSPTGGRGSLNCKDFYAEGTASFGDTVVGGHLQVAIGGITSDHGDINVVGAGITASNGLTISGGTVSIAANNFSAPSMPVGTIGSTAGFSGSGSAQLIRSSSGRKYKVDVHNLTDAPQAIGTSILEIEPVRYRDRYAVEQYISTDTGETGEPRWWVGWTAEQFIDAGWNDLAIRDPDSGEPEGLMYERVLPALVPELRARFESIEDENASLRSQVDQLATTLAAMASRLTALENK